MAVKLEINPAPTEADAGLIAITVITAAVTVKLTAGELMQLSDAAIVVLPTATPVAIAVALLIVATAVLPDTQSTWLVMSAVVASEYMPVAVKCVFSPLATVAVAGVSAMLVSVLAAGAGGGGVPPPLPPPPHADSNIENRNSAK